MMNFLSSATKYFLISFIILRSTTLFNTLFVHSSVRNKTKLKYNPDTRIYPVIYHIANIEKKKKTFPSE